MILTGVLIAARKTDKKMWKTLPSILCENFSAKLYSPRQDILLERDGLLIGDYAQAAQLPVSNAVAIFHDVLHTHSLPDTMNVIAIVDSEADSDLLSFVSETKFPAVTCGLSIRDTLSLSSITADSAVITLQRSLPCFDGTVADPQEIPVRLAGPIDSFTLMSIAATCIVTGRIDNLKYTVFQT